MKKNGGNIHTIDIIFPLLFILLFCFCALLVVLQGARIYEKTAAGLQENYTVRTAVSYLQEKVRECGDASQIAAREIDGRQVLVIDCDVNGERYASYIYQEDGKLKELFIRKEDFSGLSGGQELVDLDTFSISRPEEDLLQFDLSADGQEETVYIRAAADTTAGGDETAEAGETTDANATAGENGMAEAGETTDADTTADGGAAENVRGAVSAGRTEK